MMHICKQESKWGVYLSWNVDYDDKTAFEEWSKNISPILGKVLENMGPYDDFYLFCAGFLMCLYDTNKEMYRTYFSVVGDDGPTAYNKYNGNFRIYALTCSNEGMLLIENT